MTGMSIFQFLPFVLPLIFPFKFQLPLLACFIFGKNNTDK